MKFSYVEGEFSHYVALESSVSVLKTSLHREPPHPSFQSRLA